MASTGLDEFVPHLRGNPVDLLEGDLRFQVGFFGCTNQADLEGSGWFHFPFRMQPLGKNPDVTRRTNVGWFSLGFPGRQERTLKSAGRVSLEPAT